MSDDRSAPAPSLVGTVFGRYRLETLMGEGGMGVVYAARHLELGRLSAVKVLAERSGASELVRLRFLREGQTASSIRHPNIVDVYDVGTDRGRAYLVMELLEGEDLRGLLDREGRLTFAHAASLLVPVVAALAAAHDIGVVHRDLKPENVFLSMNRNRMAPKVLDFGVSKVVEQHNLASLTGTGTLLGTPDYMSPEQVQEAKNVDARSDQYSLGVMLYECVTGQRPIMEKSISLLIQRISRGDFAPPRQLEPGIPASFEKVILTAMAHDAGSRFPSTRALGRALLPFADDRVRSDYADELSGDAPFSASVRARSASTPPELGSTLLESVGARQPRNHEHRPLAWRTAAAFLVLTAVAVLGSLWKSAAEAGTRQAASSSVAAPAPQPVVNASAAPAPSPTHPQTIVSAPPSATVWIGGPAHTPTGGSKRPRKAVERPMLAPR
jgi:serine/threonine-protein kinase